MSCTTAAAVRHRPQQQHQHQEKNKNPCEQSSPTAAFSPSLLTQKHIIYAMHTLAITASQRYTCSTAGPIQDTATVQPHIAKRADAQAASESLIRRPAAHPSALGRQCAAPHTAAEARPGAMPPRTLSLSPRKAAQPPAAPRAPCGAQHARAARHSSITSDTPITQATLHGGAAYGLAAAKSTPFWISALSCGSMASSAACSKESSSPRPITLDTPCGPSRILLAK